MTNESETKISYEKIVEKSAEALHERRFDDFEVFQTMALAEKGILEVAELQNSKKSLINEGYQAVKEVREYLISLGKVKTTQASYYQNFDEPFSLIPMLDYEYEQMESQLNLCEKKIEEVSTITDEEEFELLFTKIEEFNEIIYAVYEKLTGSAIEGSDLQKNREYQPSNHIITIENVAKLLESKKKLLESVRTSLQSAKKVQALCSEDDEEITEEEEKHDEILTSQRNILLDIEKIMNNSYGVADFDKKMDEYFSK